MTKHTYHSRALLVLFAAAVLTAGLLALVETTPAWTASRTFVPASNSPVAVGSGPTTVTNADFNGDGKTDLAAQNSGSNNASVLLGNGDGTFQSKQDFAVGSSPSAVISKDFNSDGISDLAVTNQNSNSVSVLLGQDLNSDGKGDGTFTQKQDFAVGSNPTSVISADFNGDTYADLAVANYSANSVSVLLGQDSNGDNKADGTFRAKQDFSIATRTCADFICTWDTEAPNQVISADFNGDNKADLATANLGSCVLFCSGPGGVSVLLGKGDGTFQTYKLVKTNAANSMVPSIAAVDFNASGPLDLVATEYNSNVVSLLRGNGDGTFQTEQNLPVGSNPSAVTSADLDGDTKADDLAVSNAGSNNVSVLFNNDNGSFQAAQNFSAGSSPYFVIGANFNTDSFTDLAVANNFSNNVSVLLNTPRPDTTAPITTRSLSPQPNAAGWNREDVTITLNATDDDSGVKEISYSINGGQPTTVQQSSVQIPITNEGETTISYYATDNADNVEEQHTFMVKLDKSAPSAPVISSPANNSFDTDGTITISGTAEANSTVEVFEATASGEISKGTTPVNASGNWTKTLSGVSNGSHTYKAKAKDPAANTSGFSNARTIIVDKVKPKVSTATPTGTGVARGTNAIATFSERMDPTTITTSTFKLFRCSSTTSTDCATQITNVTITRSADRLKATLNPFGTSSSLLAGRTKFKVVLTTGAKDEAGNQLDQNASVAGNQQKVWYFTTGA